VCVTDVVHDIDCVGVSDGTGVGSGDCVGVVVDIMLPYHI